MLFDLGFQFVVCFVFKVDGFVFIVSSYCLMFCMVVLVLFVLLNSVA